MQKPPRVKLRKKGKSPFERRENVAKKLKKKTQGSPGDIPNQLDA